MISTDLAVRIVNDQEKSLINFSLLSDNVGFVCDVHYWIFHDELSYFEQIKAAALCCSDDVIWALRAAYERDVFAIKSRRR